MKNGKKKTALLAASVFAVTMNMNGCVYGPPPEELSYIPAKETAIAAVEEQPSEKLKELDNDVLKTVAEDRVELEKM